MAGVVETAFLRLKAGYDEQKLRDVTQEMMPIQAQWIRENQPQLLEGKPYDKTTEVWISEDEPPCLFLTAPWESVDGHIEWIMSKVNIAGMQKLKEFFSDDKNAVVLNHLEPAGNSEFRGDLLIRGPVKVWNISVKPEDKAALEEQYREIEDRALPGHRKWAGWKIEGETTELVIISSPGFEDMIESSIAVRYEETKVSRFGFKPFLN